MSDSEFWAVLAEMICGAGSLPGYKDTHTFCMGLCAAIESARDCGVIDTVQRQRLRDQLYTIQPPHRRGDLYFWRPGAIKTRIKACRVLARKFDDHR